MSDDSKHPSAASWAIAVVVVALLYVTSFGPASWVESRVNVTYVGRTALEYFYRPLWIAADDGPRWIRRPIVWWRDFGRPVIGPMKPMIE